MTRTLFEELATGATFSVSPHPNATVFMRMATASDALAITGEDAGAVWEFPGHEVFPRPGQFTVYPAEVIEALEECQNGFEDDAYDYGAVDAAEMLDAGHVFILKLDDAPIHELRERMDVIENVFPDADWAASPPDRTTMSYPNVDAAIDAARRVFETKTVKPVRGRYRFPNPVEGRAEGCCLVGACAIKEADGNPVFDFWDHMEERFGLGTVAVAALQNGWDGKDMYRELYENHPEELHAFDRAAALYREVAGPPKEAFFQ